MVHMNGTAAMQDDAAMSRSMFQRAGRRSGLVWSVAIEMVTKSFDMRIRTAMSGERMYECVVRNKIVAMKIDSMDFMTLFKAHVRILI